MSSPEKPNVRRQLRSLLRLRVWLGEIVRPSELQITLLWAGIIGFGGACASVGFRVLTAWVHRLVTGYDGGYVDTFINLDPWHRLLIPPLGGLLAGLTLYFGMRWAPRRSTTDYMEAIALGDGHISFRSSIVKCFSALFSIASGASIGREGPLVQLSAMLASLVGRVRNSSTLQLRLLVACGASAGIASAYNAPIGGALFVAEIVLQSVAMETFGPLVFSSVIATLTVRNLLGEHVLYEIPPMRLGSNWEILPHVVLGLLAGLLAPAFLRMLRGTERAFASLRIPTYLRLALGGLIVGALAVKFPEVCGNGYSVVNRMLRGDAFAESILLLLVLKLIATSATFGSGAVGGVFTPTLFMGACIGHLVSRSIHMLWPGLPIMDQAFTVVGMGAFLAATTHAPIMAIIMIFELTMDYAVILPLMLACVVAHYACKAFEKDSIYSESLKRKAEDTTGNRLDDLLLSDLIKADPVAVDERAGFTEIAERFLANRFNYLYVTDHSGRFRGVVSLHDIKSYLGSNELAQLVIARDLLRENFPTITPESSLPDALDRFARHDGERLPVVSKDESRRLIGSISKSDLILALAERTPKVDNAGAQEARATAA